MLRPVDWKTTKLFVEYGPGVGTFCRPILEHLPGDATLIAIDTNEDFIDYLTKDIRDSRFVAVHGSAADVEAIVAAHGFEQADYVLSGLPFSTLDRTSVVEGKSVAVRVYLGVLRVIKTKKKTNIK